MKIKSVEIIKTPNNGHLIALACVNFPDFTISGFKIIDPGENWGIEIDFPLNLIIPNEKFKFYNEISSQIQAEWNKVA